MMNRQQEISTRINQLTLVILVGFLLVAISLVFWSVVRAPALFLREDNPRLVEAELRIQRGSILDRNGETLAETMGTGNDLTRQYPIPDIGPAVGYYSFRHGTAGVEDGYNTVLRGDSGSFGAEYVRQSLHQPQVGQDIQLSLGAEWQETAVSLLNKHTGAIILIDNLTGEIIAMASTPNYDPNLLDDQFDDLIADETAPLLNRAVQGQYQAGLVLQPFIIAWALDNGVIALNEQVDNAAEEVLVGNEIITCQTSPPTPATWQDVLKHRCPAPMLDLADRLGKAGLDATFNAFGFIQNPNLPLDTETAVPEPVQDPLLAGIGQDTQIVTPIQVALATASLAKDGQAPLPWLVTAVHEEGEWLPVTPEEGLPVTAVSAQTTRQMRNSLQDGNLISYSVPVISGPEGTTNSWFWGMSPATNPRYTAVVILEDNATVNDAEEIGQTLLNQIVK